LHFPEIRSKLNKFYPSSDRNEGSIVSCHVVSVFVTFRSSLSALYTKPLAVVLRA